MSITGIATLDHAPHAANEWLKELSDEMDWEGNAAAHLLLRTGLHAVRDWLSVDEAAQLAAQMPVLIRGIYYEGWNPSSTPVHPRSKDDFLDRIANAFSKSPLEDNEKAATAVFRLLEKHISGGEVGQVKQAMKKDIQELWP